ncbi:MAG: glycine cleavage system aminomethyltransferase GcvT, partial [Anaerolineae bacterium]
IHTDPDDVFAKTPGPVVIRRLPHTLADEWTARPPADEEFDGEKVGWAFHKPYWIGQRARAAAPGGLEPLPPFAWEEPEGLPLQRTTLYDVHQQAGAKLVPFAGWEMPVRYKSVQEEHLAVRQDAGLFDVSHMGLLEFSGENVHLFVNTITSNDIALIGFGQSQYSFLLDAQGKVLDDVWVYHMDKDRYWMVVNAANTRKVRAWVAAVREGKVQIDAERPWSRALGTQAVVIRDLSDPASGAAARAQLALQGPRSRDILQAMAAHDGPLCERLQEMKRGEIIHCELEGYDLYLSRTGYTGEPMAFEIFVHPAAAAALWHALLESGEPFGLQPVGLAARDSLRIEAGLPLYGHELAGPLDLNPADAGFASYVKLYKPFFVGKAAYLAHERQRNARLVRFRFDEEHARMPRQGDVIVSRKGRVAGSVTSCSIDSEGRLTGLGYVQMPLATRGSRLVVFRADSRDWTKKPVADLETGDRVQLHDDVTVIRRFLDKRE